MNINEPQNCRTLAILIQGVVGEDRTQFLEDAKQAPDMDTFIKGMSKYRMIEG